MNYPDSVQFLYALGNEIKTAKLGLDRIRAVLDALGRPQDRCRFVHVAGTNGKGSTSAMIESGLRAAGLRTGLFTSPHLSQPTERIRIQGEPISADAFAARFDRVHAAVEDLLRSGSIDLHTTYFETVTAMALEAFAIRLAPYEVNRSRFFSLISNIVCCDYFGHDIFLNTESKKFNAGSNFT